MIVCLQCTQLDNETIVPFFIFLTTKACTLAPATVTCVTTVSVISKTTRSCGWMSVHCVVFRIREMVHLPANMLQWN